MVKCITLEYPDGTVATRGGFNTDFNTKTPNFLRRHGFAVKVDGAWAVDYDAALQYVLDNFVPAQNPGATARAEDVSFPANKTFREAWVRRAGAIEVDMPKARVIVTERLRPERDKRLTVLDIDYMRADETGDALEKIRITARKQKLRDLPAAIQSALDAIDTPEALEAWEPTWPE